MDCEKVAICKPKRGTSGETKPADPSILDAQPPELGENKQNSKPSSLGILLRPPELDNMSPNGEADLGTRAVFFRQAAHTLTAGSMCAKCADGRVHPLPPCSTR